MTMERERPSDLPVFDRPPLDEVIVGVQFASPHGYSSVRARDVWALFSDDFPQVREVPPLPPSFETFGPSVGAPGVQLRMQVGAQFNRLWFQSDDGDHLLQFQPDRLLLNWRRRPNGTSYPHFEAIARLFGDALDKLSAFYHDSLNVELSINQCEVSYINILQAMGDGGFDSAFESLHWRVGNGSAVDALAANWSEVLRRADNKPYARLLHELQTVMDLRTTQHALRFALTFRGRPQSGTIAAAMDFLFDGRRRIVGRFDGMTTRAAHEHWGRRA